MVRNNVIAVNARGNCFRLRSGRLILDLTPPSLELHHRKRDPAFFHTPFFGIALVVDGGLVGHFPAHPTSFYPGSPFDVFDAVTAYTRQARILIPRFYLYPTSRCNTRCPICQFNSRRTGTTDLPLETVRKVLAHFSAQSPRPRALSVIVSGDGEPTTHKNFADIMALSGDHEVRVFLTSNGLLPPGRSSRLVQVISDNISMMTFSIKGLHSLAYDQYQGFPPGRNGLDDVLTNLENLLNALHKNGRRQEVLVGVASLILPENTGLYTDAVNRFESLGLDYLFFNVVEPSNETFGIQFTPAQQQRTRCDLAEIAQRIPRGMMIRYPGDPFKPRFGETVYFDSRKRMVQGVCGCALWNPTLISNENTGVWLGCRSSEVFSCADLHFSDQAGSKEMADIFSWENTQSVLANTANCRQCRLERQVKLFDQLLALESKHPGKGEFMLLFDSRDIGKPLGACSFESTLSQPVDISYFHETSS